MGAIRIVDLEVYANHGVYPEENRLGQRFVVSIELDVDVSRAGETDELSDSVNYGEVAQAVDAYLREHTFKLLERAATATADMVLERFPAVLGATVEIKKPWAPVGLPLRYVSVEVERRRSGSAGA